MPFGHGGAQRRKIRSARCTAGCPIDDHVVAAPPGRVTRR